MKKLVIYHANCSDGFCAAWAAHRKFGEDADYLPASYGELPPDCTGRDVYILDFSYSYGVLQRLANEAGSLTLLDHHKTAREELKTFCEDEGFLSGVQKSVVVFDLEKSGGRLAWEHFFPGEPAPWLVRYTEDRDLWRWALPHSREVSAWLESTARDFEAWDCLYPEPGRKLEEGIVEQGGVILRYQGQQVERQCRNAVEVDIGGHRVLCVNATMLISEIAGKLAEGRPFGACFFVDGGGARVYSLRSVEGGQDVSAVAQRLGGGGHPRAAGFRVSPPGA